MTDNNTDGKVTIGGAALVAGASVPTSGKVILSGDNLYTGLTTSNSGFTLESSNSSGSVAKTSRASVSKSSSEGDSICEQFMAYMLERKWNFAHEKA